MLIRLPFCIMTALLTLAYSGPTVRIMPPLDRPAALVKTGVLADPELTPGVILPGITADDLKPGYASSVRNVPESVKRAVFKEYGYDPDKVPRGHFEVDHLVSLEIGGSNDIRNLWIESYLAKPWNAHLKDKLEDRYAAKVRRHEMSLSDAQKSIAGDWTVGYIKEFGNPN